MSEGIGQVAGSFKYRYLLDRRKACYNGVDGSLMVVI
jgi:hypothetical protein